MASRTLLRSGSLFCLSFAVFGCGAESDSSVGSRTEDPVEDAGTVIMGGSDEDGGVDDDDEAEPEADDEPEAAADDDAPSEPEPTPDDADDVAPEPSMETEPETPAEMPGSGLVDLPQPTPESVEPVEPLLPDVDPMTPVQELMEDEFTMLCEPFVDTAVSAVTNLENLCGIAAIGEAQEAAAASVEEYQRACAEARLDCEANGAALDVLAGSVECGDGSMCTATVGEIDACYAQLSLLNSAILEPLGGVDIPPCEELTPEQGAVITAQVALYLLATGLLAMEATGMPIDQESSPCDALEMTCPGLAVPGMVDL